MNGLTQLKIEQVLCYFTVLVVGQVHTVMHIALRSPKDKNFFVDGTNVTPDVHAVLEKVVTI